MKICVLVVDDEQPILNVISRAEMGRWITTTCNDAHAALEMLRSPAEFDGSVAREARALN